VLIRERAEQIGQGVDVRLCCVHAHSRSTDAGFEDRDASTATRERSTDYDTSTAFLRSAHRRGVLKGCSVAGSRRPGGELAGRDRGYRRPNSVTLGRTLERRGMHLGTSPAPIARPRTASGLTVVRRARHSPNRRRNRHFGRRGGRGRGARRDPVGSPCTVGRERDGNSLRDAIGPTSDGRACANWLLGARVVLSAERTAFIDRFLGRCGRGRTRRAARPYRGPR